MFFDADVDGDLDLFVGGYIEWPPEEIPWCTTDGTTKGFCPPTKYEGIESRFYRNMGDGTFVEATAEAGLDVGPGRTFGVAEMDFNDDGRPDIMVANDMSRNLLFVNEGNGQFDEWGNAAGVAYGPNGLARAGMGVDVGVVDRTGRETVFVANFSEESVGVFHHAGGGLFLERSESSGLRSATWRTLSFGLFLFDADLDGALDLFAANGHVQPDVDSLDSGITYRQSPQLLRNQGGGAFSELGAGDLTRTPMVARGAAYGDYDRDGDLDVLVVENGGPAHLFRNDLSAAHHYLRVDLNGRQSNRQGIGATVTAHVNGHRLVRRVHTGSSYLSHSQIDPTFGLGPWDTVDSLVVEWPAGHVDRLGPVEADRTIRITEQIGRFSNEVAAAVE